MAFPVFTSGCGNSKLLVNYTLQMRIIFAGGFILDIMMDG
jgi:hypothetical protein